MNDLIPTSDYNEQNENIILDIDNFDELGNLANHNTSRLSKFKI